MGARKRRLLPRAAFPASIRHSPLTGARKRRPLSGVALPTACATDKCSFRCVAAWPLFYTVSSHWVSSLMLSFQPGQGGRAGALFFSRRRAGGPCCVFQAHGRKDAGSTGDSAMHTLFRSSGGVPQWRCRHAASGRANAAARMCGLPCEVRIATSASLALRCYRVNCVGVLSLPPRAEFLWAGSLRPYASFPRAGAQN